MLVDSLLILAALLAVYLVLGAAIPARLFALARGLARRLAGLSLQSVDVDGTEWAYLAGGPANAEVLILLHGFGGDKDNWPAYARYFTRRYRVIIPDLPGFGESARDASADYTIGAQTGRLFRFVQALELRRFHVAGNSMGGYLALRFALEHPERVLTLGLLNNAGVMGTHKSELELAAERGESLLTVGSMQEFEKLMSLIMHRRLPVPGFVKRALCEEASRHREFLERIFWSLTEEIRAAPLNDRLPDVAVPTLILWGREDRVIDVSCAEVMAANIPTNRCVVLEKTGHIPMLERPGRTAAAHLDFIGAQRAA